MAPSNKRKGPGDLTGAAQISPEGITGLDDEMTVQLLGAGQEVSLNFTSMSSLPALADPSACTARSVDHAA
jgi:hypothetical protein